MPQIEKDKELENETRERFFFRKWLNSGELYQRRSTINGSHSSVLSMFSDKKDADNLIKQSSIHGARDTDLKVNILIDK